MKKIINISLVIMVVFFIISALRSFMISNGTIKYNEELPLIGIQGILKKNNKIYIGIGPFNRIQIYDLKGFYLGYIFTKNNRKDYDFEVDNLNNAKINVINLRESKKNIYSFQNVIFRIKSEYPAVIEVQNKKGSYVLIKNSLFFLIHYSFGLNLLMNLICISLFHWFNNSTINRHKEDNKEDKWLAYKNIFRDLFVK